MDKIEKPWCLYWILNPFIGKIVNDNGSSVDILYYEDQHYHAALWDSKYVDRFNTLKETAEAYSEKTGISLKEAYEKANDNFPSEKIFEKIKT